MKKLTALLLVAAAAVPAAVFAAGTGGGADNDITAYLNGGVITASYTEGSSGISVMTFYEDGALVHSVSARIGENGYSFNVPEEYTDADMRITYAGGGTYDVKLEKAPVQTEQPSEPPTAEPSAKPQTTPAPTRTPHPAIYPKAADARNAFAVISDIKSTMIDGENYYTLKMLYQGSEITADVRDTVEIVSAPDFSAHLKGKNAGALKDGDIIHFTTDLQGRMKTIELIYRPDFTDYINEGVEVGANFGSLISENGSVAGMAGWSVANFGGKNSGYNVYAFGVPIKANNSYIVMANERGTVMDVSIQNNTIVYVVDGGARGDKAQIAGTGRSAVMTAPVGRNDLDDDGNVVTWENVPSDDMVYALARIIDGTATDIVIFVK